MGEADGLIAGRFRIDPSRPPLLRDPALRAFSVADESGAPFAALETAAHLAPRPEFNPPLALTCPGMLLPVAEGTGRGPGGVPGHFIVYPSPPGPALELPAAPLPEEDLLHHVLAPAAAVLAALADHGLTHRAIRPGNLFRAAGPDEPVTLGPCCARPAGSGQPAFVEPLPSALCTPVGRGNGTIADDVFALGATLLCLLRGAMPADHEDALPMRRAAAGSFAALAGGMALPLRFAELLRTMLSDDPAERPEPAFLMHAASLRPRRGPAVPATRAVRRAQTPFAVGPHTVSTARELAAALATHGLRGAAAIPGAVENWIRHGLGDSHLVPLIEGGGASGASAAKGEAPPMTPPIRLLRTVAVLDPAMPLVWERQRFMPDGFAAAVAAASEPDAAELMGSLEADAVAAYVSAVGAISAASRDRPGLVRAQGDASAWHTVLRRRGWDGGPSFLLYKMNPRLPCRSPLLGGRPAVTLRELLEALEAASPALAAEEAVAPPMDRDLVAFIVARAEGRLADQIPSPGAPLAAAHLFGVVQTACGPAALPRLCRWLTASGCFGLDRFRGRSLRARLVRELAAATEIGRVSECLAVVNEPGLMQEDEAGYARAVSGVAAAEAALAALDAGRAGRSAAAERLGAEVAAGMSALAASGAALWLAASAL